MIGHGGTATIDGRIVGLVAGPHGARTVLVANGGNLYLYRAPTGLGVRVHLEVAPAAGRVLLRGRVTGTTGGRVELLCRSAGGTRLLGFAPLRGGSFGLNVPDGRCSYRAIYLDPASSIPYVAVAASSARLDPPSLA